MYLRAACANRVVGYVSPRNLIEADTGHHLSAERYAVTLRICSMCRTRSSKQLSVPSSLNYLNLNATALQISRNTMRMPTNSISGECGTIPAQQGKQPQGAGLIPAHPRHRCAISAGDGCVDDRGPKRRGTRYRNQLCRDLWANGHRGRKGWSARRRAPLTPLTG
jgi:hypothetical protein